MAYLRNRPFLVIEFFRVPATTQGPRRIHTENKHWMAQPGALSIREHPLVVDRVSDKLLQSAGVIIDLENQSVVKNTLQDDGEKVLEHFLKKYAEMVQQGHAAWARKNAR